MNRENLYLIHEDTYLYHINEKVQMYSMLKQLIHRVKNLPSNRGSKDLTRMAAFFERHSEEMFKEWNIPGSYLILGDEADLEHLMNEELACPEDVGYVFCEENCDECCPCGECCPCCEDDEDIALEPDKDEADEADAENMGEMFAVLGEVLHSLFGDNVSVHVFRE